MKCEKCDCLTRTSYEYGEYVCDLFGDDPPDFLATGEGCKLKYQELQKLNNLANSVYFGNYQWYGRTPTNEEVECYNKKVKAYNNYWEYIRKKYGVEVE